MVATHLHAKVLQRSTLARTCEILELLWSFTPDIFFLFYPVSPEKSEAKQSTSNQMLGSTDLEFRWGACEDKDGQGDAGI